MPDVSSFNRRQVIRAIGVGSVPLLSGCSSIMGSDDNENNTSGGGKQSESEGAIESVSVDGSDLDIDLDPSQPVSTIQIYGPDDEPWVDGPVQESASRRVDLMSNGYPPGENTIEVRNSDDDLVGSHTITLKPELELVKFEYLGDREDLQEEEYPNPPDYASLITIRNTGSGPDKIRGIEAPGIGESYGVGEDGGPFRGSRVIPPGDTGHFVLIEDISTEPGVDVYHDPCEGTSLTVELVFHPAHSKQFSADVKYNGEGLKDVMGAKDRFSHLTCEKSIEIINE